MKFLLKTLLTLIALNISVSCIANEKKIVFEQYLGKSLDSKEVQSLVKLQELKKEVLKGDVSYYSKSLGIDILSRKNIVWRIRILTKQDLGYSPYKGELPIEIKKDYTSKDVLKFIGKPQFLSKKIDFDQFMYYDRQPYSYRLEFTKDKLYSITISKTGVDE